MAKHCILTINEILLRVRLGCGAEERKIPQAVKVKVVMEFAKTPKALTSDDLEDTICYDVLTQALREVAESREFKLVEHLGHELYKRLAKELPKKMKAVIHVTKVSPPVKDITGGVTFSFGDRVKT